MSVKVFELPASDIRKKLIHVFEIPDESDKVLTFHHLLKEFGSEAIRQNQILYLEKKFRKLCVRYDSLMWRKRHLVYLMQAYDFSSKEANLPGQMKLFELLPQVLENDLDVLAELQKEIQRCENEKEAVLIEIMEY